MSAGSTFRVEIPITVQDKSGQGTASLQRNLSASEKAARRTQAQMQKLSATKASLMIQVTDKASLVLAKIHATLAGLAKTAISIPIKVLDFATAPLRKIMSLAHSTLGLLGLSAAGVGIGQLGIRGPLQYADMLTNSRLSLAAILRGQGLSPAGAGAFQNRVMNWAIPQGWNVSQSLGWAQRLLAMGTPTAQVMPLLHAASDAAAVGGGGSQAMGSILDVFARMRAQGNVQIGDLDMLQDANIPVQTWLQQKYGMSPVQFQRYFGSGIVPTNQVLPFLEAKIESLYGGLAQKRASSSIGGNLGILGQLFEKNIGSSWGAGLQQATLPALRGLTAWFKNNTATVKLWDKALQQAASTIGTDLYRGVDYLKDKLAALVNSPAWAKATTLGDKMQLAWSDLIVKPFDAWYLGKNGKGGTGSGKAWIISKAGLLGKDLGTGLNAAMMSALGLSKNNGQFTSAGSSAGQAFAKGFEQGFDASKVAKAIGANLTPEILGGHASLGTMATTGIGLGLGMWTLLGILGMRGGARGAVGLGGKLLGLGARGAAGGLPALIGRLFRGGSVVDDANEAIEFLGPGGSSALRGSSSILRDASLVGRLGMKSGLLRRVPILGLLLGAASIATAAPSQRLGAIGNVAGGLGGAEAGAALGTLLFPGVGTVIGGIAGGLGGGALGGWLLGLLGHGNSSRSGSVHHLATSASRLDDLFGVRLNTDLLAFDAVVTDLTAKLRIWDVSGGAPQTPGGPSPSYVPTGPGTLHPFGGPKTPTHIANGTYQAMAREAALRHGIDPNTFSRQIGQESGFSPTALSGAGAEGIAQFMPGTARGMGINPWDPAQALDAAARMDAANLKRYGGNWRLALAAYNAGAGNVQRYGSNIFNPAYLEAHGWSSSDAHQPLDYVRSILGRQGTTVNNNGHTIQATVNVNAATSDPRQFAKQIADPLMNEIAKRLEHSAANTPRNN